MSRRRIVKNENQLKLSINSPNGDRRILPHSRTKIDHPYWVKKHPGIACGQITKNIPFGKKIYEISKDETYKNYLDVGTWCGLGTTKCLLDGIILREDAKLYALETNPYFYETTYKYWDKYFEYYNINKDKFKLYNNTLVSYEEMPDDFVTDSGHKKEQYDYNGDIKKCSKITLDVKIDVLCLDGGHFSTQKEWELFKNDIKVIILDDTNTSKTRNIKKEIKESPIWEIIYESDHKNGELIAKKNN